MQTDQQKKRAIRRQDARGRGSGRSHAKTVVRWTAGVSRCCTSGCTAVRWTAGVSSCCMSGCRELLDCRPPSQFTASYQRLSAALACVWEHVQSADHVTTAASQRTSVQACALGGGSRECVGGGPIDWRWRRDEV